MTVSGRTALMIILAAAGLGFIIALAGSPGIAPPSKGEAVQVSVSVIAIGKQAADPE